MVDAVGILPQGGGDVGGFSEPEEVNGEVSKSSEILSCLRVPDSTLVFAVSGVANPMQTILDIPVLAPPTEELARISLITRNAGDGVLCLGGLFAVAQRAAC